MHARKIRFPSLGVVDLVEEPIDPPGENDLLVRLEHTVISPGTELAFLHAMPNTRPRWPNFMGYTGCGIVEQCGAKVTDFAVGDRVVGSFKHWSHRVEPAAACAAIPDSLPARNAAAFRLASIALQGVRKARIELGETAAVLGLGVIGNLAGQLCRAAGASFVAGIDTVQWRRQLCDLDATAADVEGAKKEGPKRVRAAGFDVVIEATGAPDAVKSAFAAAKRMGRVILLGSTRGLTDQVNFYSDVHKKGLHVIGAHDSLRGSTEDFPGLFTHDSDQRTVIDLMAAGRINVGPLVSEWVKPQAAPSAYARLHAREAGLMTIGIDWD